MPVIFLESEQLCDCPEESVFGGVPKQCYEVPFGEPAPRKEGTDLTFLTIAAMLCWAIEVAKERVEKYDVSCEIIDAVQRRTS